MSTSTKVCNQCQKEKELNDFVKRSNRASGRQPYCKDCHNKSVRNKYCSKKMKDYDLFRSYGITLKEYNLLFKNQEGCCAICEKHLSELNDKHKKSLCVDHNHKTGFIRGLLCDKCNRGIGLLCDSEKILLNALKYLAKNR
jgi:hypothetical protein